MRRLLVALAVASLVLVGCETSQVDGSATVTVSGRILRADGSPAARVAVGLEEEPSLGELAAGTLIVPLTLFTACLADPPPALCRDRDVRRTTTAADGTYSFQMRGSDTQTFFGNVRDLSVSAELPPATGEVAGAAVNAVFNVQTENLRLPDLQLWEPQVAVGRGRIGWEPLAGAGGYQVGVEDTGAEPVWTFESRGREVTFDPRILEDTAGSLAVSTRAPATAEGTTVSILRRSARVAYRSTAGPPISRGQPCAPRDIVVARCPLTDGDFTTRLPAPPASTSTTTTTTITNQPAPGPTVASPSDWVSIDLGRPRDVALVVVRGCACQVEGSVDGQRWTPLGRSTGFTAVVPARTGPARYVRLSGSVAGMGEVSIWDASPPPSPPATAGPTPEVAAPPALASPGGTGSSSRTAPALVALVAVLAAAVVTAAVAARDRR